MAFAALLSGALCIAFAPIWVRLSELAPTATAFYRMFLSLPLFLLWIRIEGRNASQETRLLPRPQRTWLLLSGIFFAGDLAVWHWSITYTSVANATLLANFTPIFVTAAAWFFLGERITLQFIAGLGLALFGAGLLVHAGSGLGGNNLLGDVLALTAAVLYAGYLISLKEVRRRLSTAVLMGTSSLISCLALLAITLISGENLMPASFKGWLILLALAGVSQVGGQGLIAFGLAYLPASFSSVSLLLQPVAAAGLAWLILGEAMRPLQGLGGVIVITGILLARKSGQMP